MNLQKLKPIKLLILDVDGVLTDGRVIYTDSGEEIKQFDAKDGHGLKLLMRSGIGVALLTGRQSKALEHRARDLGIEHVYQKAIDKIAVYEKILTGSTLEHKNVAFVGDDLVDIPVLKKVGFSAAVPDAVPEVKEIVDYITCKNGGEGAVREICELLLKAQNKWQQVTEKYHSA